MIEKINIYFFFPVPLHNKNEETMNVDRRLTDTRIQLEDLGFRLVYQQYTAGSKAATKCSHEYYWNKAGFLVHLELFTYDDSSWTLSCADLYTVLSSIYPNDIHSMLEQWEINGKYYIWIQFGYEKVGNKIEDFMNRYTDYSEKGWKYANPRWFCEREDGETALNVIPKKLGAFDKSVRKMFIKATNNFVKASK